MGILQFIFRLPTWLWEKFQRLVTGVTSRQVEAGRRDIEIITRQYVEVRTELLQARSNIAELELSNNCQALALAVLRFRLRQSRKLIFNTRLLEQYKDDRQDAAKRQIALFIPSCKRFLAKKQLSSLSKAKSALVEFQHFCKGYIIRKQLGRVVAELCRHENLIIQLQSIARGHIFRTTRLEIKRNLVRYITMRNREMGRDLVIAPQRPIVRMTKPTMSPKELIAQRDRITGPINADTVKSFRALLTLMGFAPCVLDGIILPEYFVSRLHPKSPVEWAFTFRRPFNAQDPTPGDEQLVLCVTPLTQCAHFGLGFVTIITGTPAIKRVTRFKDSSRLWVYVRGRPVDINLPSTTGTVAVPQDPHNPSHEPVCPEQVVEPSVSVYKEIGANPLSAPSLFCSPTEKPLIELSPGPSVASLSIDLGDLPGVVALPIKESKARKKSGQPPPQPVKTFCPNCQREFDSKAQYKRHIGYESNVLVCRDT